MPLIRRGRKEVRRIKPKSGPPGTKASIFDFKGSEFLVSLTDEWDSTPPKSAHDLPEDVLKVVIQTLEFLSVKKVVAYGGICQ